MRNQLSGFVLAVASLACCGIAQAANVMSFLGSVHLTGPIEPGDAARVAATFEKFDSSPPLYIVSQGGNLKESLKLPPIIKAKAAKVRVSGLCVSACASVLLPSHSVREARKTAVIAFHATDSIWFLEALDEMESLARADLRFAENLGDFIPRSRNEVQALEEQLKAAFSLSGVDFEMFARASHFTRKRLKRLQYDSARKELDIDPEPATTCSYWVPDEIELRKMGIEFRGGYKRLPLPELAEQLKVPPSQILLSLEDAEVQCQQLPKG